MLDYFIDQLSPTAYLDIGLVAIIVFGLLILIRGTRAMSVLRGLLLFVVGLWLLSLWIDLTAFRWVVSNTLPGLLVAIPVLFQPELRRALEQMGQLGRWFRFLRRNRVSPTVVAVTRACLRLSQRRHGALIVFEQETGLQEYIDTGILLDAEPTAELFLTVFNKHTELHDGAVIIRQERLAAAACVMPLSRGSISDRQMGLRHRAALGISEVSDALTLIVSEETGQISITHNGRMFRRQDPARLTETLQAFLQRRNVEQVSE